MREPMTSKTAQSTALRRDESPRIVGTDEAANSNRILSELAVISTIFVVLTLGTAWLAWLVTGVSATLSSDASFLAVR